MTKYYLTSPFCETFTSREEAAGTIADLFCDQASERGTDARRAFCAYCEDCAWSEIDGDMINSLELFGFLIDDDTERMQWAEYKAYDLLDDAGRLGCVTLYGVTVYANAKAAVLEERASDAFDPWCGPDARVALFCAIYNGGKELEWLLEQLHDLAHEVDPEEAEKILALCADISRFDRERRPA